MKDWAPTYSTCRHYGKVSILRGHCTREERYCWPVRVYTSWADSCNFHEPEPKGAPP